MKNIAWIVAALFVLAACGKESPQDATPAPAEPVEQSVEAATDDAAEAAETDPVDDTLEVVEESAAEPEETEAAEIVLARADADDATTASYDFKFNEGEHYHRLVPTQPTFGGADKIEVAEFFWYGCPHCFDLEDTINRWEANKPASVRFVKVPAMWNEVLRKHAQLYYTEEILVRNGVIKDAAAFRRSVFEEYHRRGNRLLTDQAIARHFARYGVSEEEFTTTWNSFEVSQKMRVAADLARRYGIAGVPAIVVNGKYRTGGAEAGSYPALIEVIDELVIREGAR